MLIGENKIGNLGIAPALVYAIFQVAVLAISAGKSYYDSLQEARKQQREQRYLDSQELVQLATLFQQKYPSISYSDWFDYVKLTNIIYPATSNGGDGTLPPPLKPNTNYWMYVAIFVAILVVTKK